MKELEQYAKSIALVSFAAILIGLAASTLGHILNSRDQQVRTNSRLLVIEAQLAELRTKAILNALPEGKPVTLTIP